ncbi:hypothetical protein [Enterovirga rhinocerotis]|uniref:Uncharacterized protein n=1 Tax=Enterovirga rhinocerotis TaxID=1339210 RepID=A0A4R7BKS1_9HYPH|nr:hypothetical protein [Enterovirga rhinocerotis]TDR85182.1 hypothetical protein EV668_4726 [Enterovirga rhinocerotis]
MTVLLGHLWPALAVAAVLGLGFSAVFGAGAGLPSATLPVRIGMGLALIAAALVSVLNLVPGRAGLWFDIAAAIAWAYAAGVVAGLLPRRVLRSRKREELPPPVSVNPS